MKKNTGTKSLATGIERVLGLVILRGQARSLCCPWPLMVLDTPSWAKSLLSRAQDEARLAHEGGDVLSSVDAEQIAAEIAAWLADHQQVTCSLPPLALRQKIEPAEVGETAIHEYVLRLLDQSPHTAKMNVESIKVEFILDMDARTLTATKSLRVAVNHCGSAVTGVLVSQAELENRVARVLLEGTKQLLGRKLLGRKLLGRKAALRRASRM